MNYLLEESKQLIKKKKYKKAYTLIEKYYYNPTTREYFTLLNKMQLNRRIFYCLNKILRGYFSKNDLWSINEIT